MQPLVVAGAGINQTSVRAAAVAGLVCRGHQLPLRAIEGSLGEEIESCIYVIAREQSLQFYRHRRRLLELDA